MGCAASTPAGPVSGSESGHQGSHPSSPSASATTNQTQPPKGAMAPTRSNGGSAKPDAAASAPRADASAPTKKPGDISATVAKEGDRRRKSSEELEKQFAEQAAEPTFKPVSKGKVSDATFGTVEERLRLTYRSQDDAGAAARQLGMMQSPSVHRLGFEESSGGRAGTRGGESPPSNGGRRGRSRAEMALERHTLDTAPGAQGVVRHTEWVSANSGRRGHRNVIESQPERIAFQGGGKAAIAPPPEERRLDRLEAKFLKETLSKHWLFENFSDAQFSILTKNCETVELKEGQPLILQGAEDDGRMYILHRGTLSVHVLDSKKKDGDKKDGADNGADRSSDPPGAQQPQAAGHADRGVHVATVLSGGWVGDMALLYKTTRTATVIAEGDSRVLAVPRLAYENVIAEGYEADAVETSATNEFATVPVLCNLKDSNALTQQARGVSWSAGEVLIESGMGARELLIITHGEVEFQNRAAASGGLQAGGEYRWSLQQAFISPDKLAKGDVMAAGRPGDEALLVTLHNQGLARAVAKHSTAKLKLAGGLAPGTANAVATTDGKGYRVYLQDVVTHTALLEPLSDSLEGIRSLLQCTPALAKQLSTAGFDAASFVMHPVKYNAGTPIPMAKAKGDSKTGGNPLMVLVSGKVGVRRSDDVSIRGESDPPPKDSDGKKDEGIVARLYDVMTTIVPEDAPSHKLVAKTNCTLLAMNRTDHADLTTRHEALSFVRTYPCKRPLSAAAAEFGARASSDGNVMRIEDLSFERKIGQGAYGAVYLVVHRPTGRTLAAKIIKLARLRKHQKDDAINVERHVMQDSSNPFIVRLYATHKTKTHLLLVMEAGLGGELFSFLLRQEHQVLREDSVRFYGACVLSALHAMHDDGYMYRDLKPENVVITADGYCKIVDFGFAKRTAARTYTVCGTNAYLSPEMLTVQGHNFEVDYWAFGVFLYEMAIGCASFNVEPDGTMNHEMPPFKVCQNILNPNYRLRFDIGVYRVSPELQDVITQLLERRVEHRIGCRVRGAQELYEHPFFAPIDFEKLTQFQYQPPWNPELQNALDTRYFESTHKMRKSELVAFGITTSDF